MAKDDQVIVGVVGVDDAEDMSVGAVPEDGDGGLRHEDP
jgi:hypothetical protein